MKKFSKNSTLYFIPECYFDTVIVKKLLGTNKRLLHLKGCNNVINKLKGKDLKNEFAVAIIDKDKKEVDYLGECSIVREVGYLILWKHNVEKHFIFQLNPPIEKWTFRILQDAGLKLEDFGYSSNFKSMKKAIKEDLDDEDDKDVVKLADAIIATKCETITFFKASLQYLKEKNYAADINELKNV